MCGIVGAAARRDIVPVLIEGLRRLEYRGYDSCGVATLGASGLDRVRSVARVEDLAYLRPDPGQAPRRASDFTDPSQDDLADDIRLCVDLARQRGLEVLALDQTRPDIGLRVVRVVVPGLCHFWRRLGFRRLYEVPVAQGWLPRPFAPDELNPYTVFF